MNRRQLIRAAIAVPLAIALPKVPGRELIEGEIGTVKGVLFFREYQRVALRVLNDHMTLGHGVLKFESHIGRPLRFRRVSPMEVYPDGQTQAE